MLRPTVSRLVCLGTKHPFGAYDQIFITRMTVAGLLIWGVLSDERTSPRFIAAARTAQKTSSIKTCSFVSGGTCPKSCSLATVVVLVSVYKDVTWQWVYIWQYMYYTSHIYIQYYQHSQNKHDRLQHIYN
jgi:hypothetical protein